MFYKYFSSKGKESRLTQLFPLPKSLSKGLFKRVKILKLPDFKQAYFSKQ